ncbi:MAG: L,D-transpeptidase [Chloroflexota bacterium]
MKAQYAAFIIFTIIIILLPAPVSAQDSYAGLPDDQILAYPEPAVTQLELDYGLLNQYAYRRVLEAAEIYSAPDGEILETLDPGYNFVSIWQIEDGWAQIGVNRWVQEDKLSDVIYPSGFRGVLLPEGAPPYTIAWMLVNIHGSKIPGHVGDENNPRLSRYQLVNIYSTVEVDGWRWYQVGIDQWVKQTNVAKILSVSPPDGINTQRWVSIDLYEQVAVAYDGGRPVFATLVSSGLPEWSTREGVFNIWLNQDRTEMSGSEGQPDFYYLEDVPWTMYFDHAIALHGTYWHNSFGWRHSHGCVNLSIIDAHWLYEWLAPEWNGDQGASVYVYTSDRYQ